MMTNLRDKKQGLEEISYSTDTLGEGRLRKKVDRET